MIEVEKAEKYRCCNVCKSQQKVFNITFWAKNTNSGTQVSLCEKCLNELKIKIAEPERKWIPVSEALPKEGESVIVCSRYGAICIAGLVKGISKETRKKMKNGEIDDPCEKLWCLSDGYKMSKRSDLYTEGDEFGNNQKDYAWRNGPYHYSGQEFIAWMQLPEVYRGE